MPVFKNAPAVDKFAVGMAFKHNAVPYRIVSTNSSCDEALTTTADSPRDHADWWKIQDVAECVLDLDSIWVGREYVGRENSEIVTVVALSPHSEFVAFQWPGGTCDVYSTKYFLDHCVPVALEPPLPCEVGDIVRVTFDRNSSSRVYAGIVEHIDRRKLVLSVDGDEHYGTLTIDGVERDTKIEVLKGA